MTATYHGTDELPFTTDLPAGLGLAAARPRRNFRAWLERTIIRLRVDYALAAVRADIRRMPESLRRDIGIPADEIERIATAARRIIVRQAIRVKLDRTGPSRGARAWTP